MLAHLEICDAIKESFQFNLLLSPSSVTDCLPVKDRDVGPVWKHPSPWTFKWKCCMDEALRWWLFKVIMLYLPGSCAYGIPCCRHLRTLILTIFKKKIRSLDHLGPNAGEPWVLNNPFWPNSVMIGTEEFWYDFFTIMWSVRYKPSPMKEPSWWTSKLTSSLILGHSLCYISWWLMITWLKSWRSL